MYPTAHRLRAVLRHSAASPQVLASLLLAWYFTTSSWLGLAAAVAAAADVAFKYFSVDDPLQEESKVG